MPHPPLVCHCIYLSFLLPSLFFYFWQEKTLNISPPFFKSLKACEDKLERAGVPFFSKCQPSKCNSFSALEKSPFPQRPKQQQPYLQGLWNECCEGTSRAYPILHTQAAASCSQHLFFFFFSNVQIFSIFFLLFCSYYMLNCYGSVSEIIL